VKDDARKAARHPEPSRHVPLSPRQHPQHPSPALQSGQEDRLERFRERVRRALRREGRPAGAADPASGRPALPQAHLPGERRERGGEVPGESVLAVLLRVRVFPAPLSSGSVDPGPVAQARGAGRAGEVVQGNDRGGAAGEPVAAIGRLPGDRRHDRAGEGDRVSHGRSVVSQGAAHTGSRGEAGGDFSSAELRTPGEKDLHAAGPVRPCPPGQACWARDAKASRLSGPRNPGPAKEMPCPLPTACEPSGDSATDLFAEAGGLPKGLLDARSGDRVHLEGKSAQEVRIRLQGLGGLHGEEELGDWNRCSARQSI